MHVEERPMTQVTVRLPDELSRALKTASRRMQRRTSDIVRMALQEFLAPAGVRRGRPADRVRGLIGSLETGVPDLAENHRAHILASLKRGR
jgi:metal-responsive CopG/Arc/MetJ family transcriptional regulator